jgi:DNA-binding LacI/PurR family transcriptional regulator
MKEMSIDDEAIQHCIELRLSGVMAVYQNESSVHQLYKEMSRYEVPVAVLDNTFALPWAVRVVSDDADGCRLAIEHLVSLGHCRIACITAAPFIPSAVLRADGYLAAMKAFGLDVPDDYLKWGAEWDVESAVKAARELFSLDPDSRPTAIFCAGDLMAMVAIREARKAGLRLPEELSVVGYADFSMAALCDPPLTTVAQPFEEMGRRAVRELLDCRKGEDLQEQLKKATSECIIATRLVVRESTAPPPA